MHLSAALCLLSMYMSTTTSAHPVTSSSSSASSSLLHARNASCPQIFTLTVGTPDLRVTDWSVIASGPMLYLYNGDPQAKDNATHDAVVRFYRNDTTHLYATGFDIFYTYGTHYRPPYQLYTKEDLSDWAFLTPSDASELDGAATSTFDVLELDDGSRALSFESEVGGPGGIWVCELETSPFPTVYLGAFAGHLDGCQQVNMTVHDVDPIAADVC